MANFPEQEFLSAILANELLYGENAAQSPAAHFRTGAGEDPLALHCFKLLVGNPSYNNLVDIDRLLQTMTHVAAAFDLNHGRVPKIAIAVKHGNACGASVGYDAETVLMKMVDGDRRAIMGGLVMTNFAVDEALAETLITYGMAMKPGSDEPMRRLLDGVIVPSVTEGALASMKRKGDKCRVFTNPALAQLTKDSLDTALLRRQVRGGYVLQPNYKFVLDLSKATGLVESEPTPELPEFKKADILLAWAICATSTSNTITIVKNGALRGNGVGQQDRVGAAKLAIDRSRMSNELLQLKYDLDDAVAASDSFFPFPDGLEELAKAGIKTVFTTSGSVKDKDVAARAKELGVQLLALPDKVARGFFNH